MAEGEPVLRIAARGDGVTASGHFVAGAAPGDMLLADGTLVWGPHHVSPRCRHFGACGGCQLQQLDEEALARFVGDRVVHAALGQGLEAERIGAPHLSPAASRRRATLHAERRGGAIVLGYREAGSHRLVDLRECPVLLPELAALLARLRGLLAALVASPGKGRGRNPARLSIAIDVAIADQGCVLGLKGLAADGLAAREALLAFARSQKLARLSLDDGYGPEPLWEPEPATVTLSGVAVPLPAGAFLQPTADGEAALVGAACEWLAGAARVADLFAGLGTFAFALAAQGSRVLAVEAERSLHLACRDAAARARRPVTALHRDLFRGPLLADELAGCEGVLLDPPRAGAREQVARLAGSGVPRIVYVSCNPGSWARDAAILVAGGYRLAELRPVGQFRWSTHVELASLFVRP
ncbi:MAG: class I SAM-dependent RNA methyltransferase [Sphingomonadales bacterium]|nr:class I SAM-dependent RNA methyltransferase [Sphingomonadales bacterium]